MSINLRRLFLDYQNELLASLWKYRSFDHPGEKGDLTEGDWRGLLRRHLPRRYDVSTGFVVDCRGAISLQIDAIIHDRYFSPLFFNKHDILFVPAESVYSVFEIKQEVDATTFGHACDKAESVRKLFRTNAMFPAVANQQGRGKPFDIIAGILCTRSSWSPPLTGTLQEKLKAAVDSDRRLDMGCILQHGSFAFNSSQAPFDPPGFPKESNEKWGKLLIEEAEGALVRFFMFLWQGLQRLGNVTAIDFREYAAMPDSSDDQELLVHAEELERLAARLPQPNSPDEDFRKRMNETAELMRAAVQKKKS
jgi:hypothetical protein